MNFCSFSKQNLQNRIIVISEVKLAVNELKPNQQKLKLQQPTTAIMWPAAQLYYNVGISEILSHTYLNLCENNKITALRN